MQSLKSELQSIKADNLGDRKTKHELNVVLLHSLYGIKQNPTHTSSNVLRRNYKNKIYREEEESQSSSSHKTGKRGSYNTSTTASSSPPRYRKNSKHSHSSKLKGEFKNIKASFFEGDLDSRENAEEWLLGISKYFHVYAHPSELKARLARYNLNGKAARWWGDLKLAK